MEKKGLTISIIFEAESANYSDGVGNLSSLKKVTRETGESYSYISRQAIRYNIVNQMGVDNTKLGLDTVIQYAPDVTITESPEIDLFGYMKTIKPVKTRAAVVRLSNAIALEVYRGEFDFLTNKALFDRYTKQEDRKVKTKEQEKSGGDIAQSEIQKSYYSYTITIDLDKVGIDENDKIELEKQEKYNRVVNLLGTVKFLYRDIRGRREDLKPIFIIGGIYNRKNPFFENKLKIKNNKLNVETIKDILSLDTEVLEKTQVGLIRGFFDNDEEIKKELESISIAEFFDNLEKEIKAYYGV